MTFVRTVRDWVFSVPTVVLFGLSLGVHDLAGRVALRFGLRPFERVMASLQRSLLWVFRISNVRIDVERHADFDEKAGYVLVSNHQSMLDVPIFGGLLRSYPKYVAKASLGRWIPSVSLNLTRGGNALIDRDDRSQALRAIRDLGRECQERGTSVVIFPEGTRARYGDLGTYHTAGAGVLMKAASEMPVVPTVIDGSWKVFERNLFPIPFGTRVRVYFGEPIARNGAGNDREIIAATEEIARATLERWRGSSES